MSILKLIVTEDTYNKFVVTNKPYKALTTRYGVPENEIPKDYGGTAPTYA